jgi:hypothetical protein
MANQPMSVAASTEIETLTPIQGDNIPGLAGQERILLFPMQGTWYVCQGYYGPISHTGNIIYSLDLTTDPNSFAGPRGCSGDSNAAAKKDVYAPANGTIMHSRTLDLMYLKLDSGGCLMVGHLSSRKANNSKVKQGDKIGTIASAAKTNGNYAHLHLTAFSNSDCVSGRVPFDEAHNFRFTGGPNLTVSGTSQQHRGKKFTQQCQYSRADYYNNRTLSGAPAYVRCENWPVDKDWGTGSPANIGSNNFSVRWTGKADFNAGYYNFIARADDGVKVWLDDTLIISAWRDQSPTEYCVSKNVSTGAHNIKMEYYENSGGAVAQFRWEQAANNGNLALNKPSWSTSQENSNFNPCKGNDGKTVTRWSSDSSNTDQWWIVDLGSTREFNQFVVRWDSPFAANYFVGWSDDGNLFKGYWTSLSFARTYIHNLGTQNARYAGILMRQHASLYSNYAFWEFEVYFNPSLAPLMEMDNPIIISPEGSMVEIQAPAGIITIEETPEQIPEGLEDQDSTEESPESPPETPAP